MLLVKFIIDAILIEVEHFIIKIFGQRSKGILPNTVQTNLSNMETEGTEQSVRIREVSVVWRSWILRHFKGSIDGIKCSLSQNWPKQVFEVHSNCLMDKSLHYKLYNSNRKNFQVCFVFQSCLSTKMVVTPQCFSFSFSVGKPVNEIWLALNH